MASIKIFLQRLGFTENEAVVYDFLLKEGSATAQEVYKSLSLNRVTVYEIMKRFLKRGFVSKSKRIGKDLFVLESPDRLKDLIAEKKLHIKRLETEAKELEEVFEDDFSQIKQVQEAREKELEVKFYKGIKEFSKIREKNRQEILYSYSIFDKEIVNRWFPYKKRKNEIWPDNPSFSIYTAKKHFRSSGHNNINNTLIYVPKEKFLIKGEIAIINGEVYLVDSVNEEFKAIIIKNKNIAQTIITLINMASEVARRDALHIKEGKNKPPKRIV